jgi:hypothetical protein
MDQTRAVKKIFERNPKDLKTGIAQNEMRGRCGG